MTAATTQTRVPRGVKHLTDVEHARALHAFFKSEGDLSKTHAALNKRVSMRTLSWYCANRKWEVLLEEMRSDLVREVVDDAKTQHLANLHTLAVAKERVAQFITRGAKPKTLGEAVNALVSVIRLEREMLGGALPLDADAAVGVLKYVADAVKQAQREGVSSSATAPDGGNGGNGDLDDDPFGLRKDLGSQ